MKTKHIACSALLAIPFLALAQEDPQTQASATETESTTSQGVPAVKLVPASSLKAAVIPADVTVKTADEHISLQAPVSPEPQADTQIPDQAPVSPEPQADALIPDQAPVSPEPQADTQIPDQAPVSPEPQADTQIPDQAPVSPEPQVDTQIPDQAPVSPEPQADAQIPDQAPAEAERVNTRETEVQPLIDHIASLNTPQKGMQALYQKRLLTLLPQIRDGADVDLTLPETKGNTALHYACALGDVATTTWLLENGANVNIRTNAGKTPMGCIGPKNGMEIRALLIKHGASASKN